MSGRARFPRWAGAVRRPPGASAADVDRRLPGDDLVPDAVLVLDRVMDLPGSTDLVWPWLVQLGKGRAGWYLPGAVERIVPRSRRAARAIEPRFQRLRAGDDVPDWGPGRPVFQATVIAPPTALVYLSLRQRSNGWAWPVDGRAGPGVLALSWALVLQPVDPQSCRLHIRLRLKGSSGRRPVLMSTVGAFVDWATIELLRRGLIERLRAQDAGSWNQRH